MTKTIDLNQLRAMVPPETFELPRFRSFAKALFLLALLGAALVLGSWLESVPLKLLLGVVMGPFVFALASIGHESGHGTASRWRFLNDLTGVLSMSSLGIPARGWKVKHDLHHKHGGVPGRDTDSCPSLESYLTRGRISRWMQRNFHRYQFLLWWAAPLSLWLNSWIFGIRNLRNRATHFRRRYRWTLVDLAISSCFFAGVALYTAFAGWQNLLLLVALPFGVSGVVAAVCFVPNHRAMPPLTKEQAQRPIRYSHLHSRTIVYPSYLPANWFMNHVPWQIEHHVFPTVAGHRLRAFSPHLRAYADREGIALAHENAFEAVPRLLRDDWLWAEEEGKLYTWAEAEKMIRTRERAQAS